MVYRRCRTTIVTISPGRGSYDFQRGNPDNSMQLFWTIRARPGDVPLAHTSREPVHRKTAGGFAAAIEPRDYAAVEIDDLTARVDPQTRPRIVDHGRRPRGVERPKSTNELKRAIVASRFAGGIGTR